MTPNWIVPIVSKKISYLSSSALQKKTLDQVEEAMRLGLDVLKFFPAEAREKNGASWPWCRSFKNDLNVIQSLICTIVDEC